jgi:hypothetical protein
MRINASDRSMEPPTAKGREIHEVTINVADWFGHRKGNIELDKRNKDEFGSQGSGGGSLAEIKFLKTPEGKHPRILRFTADVYGMFTWRADCADCPAQGAGARAVVLHAIHSKNDFSTDVVSVSGNHDCLMWLQTPIGGDGGAFRTLQRDVGHLPTSLCVKDSIWFKLSMFANPTGDEVLSEMTVSLEYCYE